MQTLYCISGLGADEGIFKYLDLSFVKPVFIKWLDPAKDETMADYALRLKQEFITDESPLILGLSLGGMLASELAKAIHSAKIIIVSSAKTRSELPFYFRVFKYLPLYRVLPEWSVRKYSSIRNHFLGAYSEPARNYVMSVAANADIHFYRWAIGAIVNWNNTTKSSNITHIHGTRDELLPYRFVKPDITIKKGGHLMIIENAGEVSELIKKIVVT